jgi:hypothetical protein
VPLASVAGRVDGQRAAGEGQPVAGRGVEGLDGGAGGGLEKEAAGAAGDRLAESEDDIAAGGHSGGAVSRVEAGDRWRRGIRDPRIGNDRGRGTGGCDHCIRRIAEVESEVFRQLGEVVVDEIHHHGLDRVPRGKAQCSVAGQVVAAGDRRAISRCVIDRHGAVRRAALLVLCVPQASRRSWPYRPSRRPPRR